MHIKANKIILYLGIKNIYKLFTQILLEFLDLIN